jgi:hypothetical protein
MNKVNIKTILISLIILLAITSAHAGYNITRMTTIVDDFNGSYTVTKSGRLDDHVFSGTSITDFSNFHPFPAKDEASLSGTLSKTIDINDGRTTSSDAQLTLSNVDNTLIISFTDLVYEINQGVVSLSGEVTANEQIYDVADLTPGLKKLLKKVFLLTNK